VLTHCNTGWLATTGRGTALAAVYEAAERGIPLHVWVTETRPREPEGARAANWAFDVTPAGLVSGLITERGVARATRSGLAALFPEKTPAGARNSGVKPTRTG
jgi:methylthioribose-1-phosphate isomerase